LGESTTIDNSVSDRITELGGNTATANLYEEVTKEIIREVINESQEDSTGIQ
jgi:hypothetical protein